MRWRVHATAAAALFLAEPATAHGLGERYSLPLPLDLYLLGAALVVALSFAVPLAFARLLPEGAAGGPSLPGSRWLALAIRVLSAASFVLLVAAGLLGSQDVFKNPLPVSVWVLGWVGIAYACGLLGNVWALINPWDNLFRLAERAWRVRPLLRYPAALGVWPAAAFFFVFAWMELIWPERDHPDALALVLIGYSGVTWAGMVAFGRRTWRDNGEAFAVAFGLLARFAVCGWNAETRRIVLRLPAAALLARRPWPPSLAAFALLMLASVTFDGLLETPLWAGLAKQALASPLVRGAAEFAGLDPYVLVATVALVTLPLLFAAAYLTVAAAMAAILAQPTGTVACLFVLTLVPIAIGYHLAHYLSYLLIAGQFIIPILSDPFALGWNLFGTRLYLIDFSVIDARAVWYASLVFIVAGHVLAVWLAHAQARRSFDGRGEVRSQIPMLVLMVGYTAVSLWILAQPITERAA